MKIVGMGMIGIGIIGWLRAWVHNYRSQIKCLESVIALLRHAIHTMESNPRPWQEFFASYEGQDKNLNEFVKKLWEYLSEFRFATGEESWREAMKVTRIGDFLPEEGCTLLSEMSKGFFGISKEENQEVLTYYKRRVEECLKEEKRKFSQQRKIVLPMGALGGVMLVILLL